MAVSVGITSIGSSPGRTASEGGVSSKDTSVKSVNVNASAIRSAPGKMRSFILYFTGGKRFITLFEINLGKYVAKEKTVSIGMSCNVAFLRLDVFNVWGATNVIQNRPFEGSGVSVEDVLVLYCHFRLVRERGYHFTNLVDNLGVAATDVLQKTSNVGVLGHTVLQLDDVRVLLCGASNLGDGDGSRSSESRCDQGSNKDGE
jgi:hypothetical protein